MQKEQFRHRHRLWDRLGISASALCLVHCVALPFLLAGIPTLARFESSLGTGFHIAMAVLVTATVVPALRGGFKRHRDVPTLAFGGWGLSLILIGLLTSDGHGGHDHGSHAEIEHHAGHDHGHDHVHAAHDHTEHDHAAHDHDHAEHDHAAHDHDHAEHDHAAHDHDHAEHDHAAQDHGHAGHDDGGDHAEHQHSLMSRESILTMLGSVFLVTAHVRNLSKCREGCQLEGCDQHD